MKKPIAIILAVVLLLGIGAGVFWGHQLAPRDSRRRIPRPRHPIGLL